MNHLAHLLLAGDDEALRLGGLLGDFVHGAPDPALPSRVVLGIRLHRAIDVHTDRHPEVVAARARFEPPYRRYAGIALDLWFDHRLARDFARWSAVPLAAFSDAARELLRRHDALLPPALRRFRAYMEAHDLPAGYARREEIGRALEGVAGRLRRDNPLDRMLPLLVALDAPLQAHFEVFFPQLREFAQAWIEVNAAG
ncbi:ACP phosphodiesterase [Rhodanobacter sp. Si-c]|uniref:ACP phosphodiesterase n=1 Tax=Rhodanobacter lycopersici TaxID=3162487 RepID=A0ABV3QD70_9GAMM